ncbi:MAG: hypothetical protein ACYC6Y_05525 [Thermoguttaceae bacterium]
MANTKASGHRRVHFKTIADLLAEVNRVVEADRAGRIQVRGSWTPGQILGHLAAWIEYGYSGCP